MSEQEELKIEAITARLRERIARGDFGTSGRLPTVTQLAKEYQIARATMYQILSLLRSEGLLIVKGTSYYVQYPILRIEDSPLFDQVLIDHGLTPHIENLIKPDVIPASADVADGLGIQEGTQVAHRWRRMGTPEVPYRLQEQWFPYDLAGQFLENMDLDPKFNVAGAIREATGIAVTRYHDDLWTRFPTSEEMRLLNIVRTTPVLEVHKQFFSQDDRIMVLVRSTLVGAYAKVSYNYPHKKREGKQK